MAHQWLKWPAKLELVGSVFRLHPEVMSATLFGSRAKGIHTHRSAPRRSRPSWRSCRCRIGSTCNPWPTFSTAHCWSTFNGWGFSSVQCHDSESCDAELRL
jgi:hypothetical protein